MSIVKVQHKGQMTIPNDVRSAVGLADGSLVDVKAARGKIIITPQLVIDRSKFPNADDEYTPAQRRIIDARLAKAMAEVKKGNVSPTFKTIAEFSAALKADAKKLHHPSLHAKKYDESQDRWQARVNRDWRFYFTIESDTYVILDIIPHPKT